MTIPTWLFWLLIELIVTILALLVWTLISWKRASRRQLQEIHRLQSPQQNRSPATADDAELADCQQQLRELQIQLEKERRNPFLQEKIDALTAENEDLQAELDNLK